MDTNDEPPYGRNAFGAPTNDDYKKPSAALTLLPSIKKHVNIQELEVPGDENEEEEEQILQQTKYKVTTENLKENDTLIDVVAATMTAAIKRNGIQRKQQQQDLTTVKAEDEGTTSNLLHKLPTADGWNSVSTRTKTELVET